MTDDKTPGDGTHELRLPGKPGADASAPSNAESSESSSSSGPASRDAQTPAKAAEGFTWGLRPRGPDRTSAPPTAAIILPSFVQPELPTNGAQNAAADDGAQNRTATGDGAQNGASQNDASQTGSTATGRTANGSIQNGAGTAAAAGARPVPATSRRARVTEPTEPPPLVEPPRTKRTASAVELATQAMSLEEILAAQEAGPVTRETWSRPIPTQGAQNNQAARSGQSAQNGQNGQSAQQGQSPQGQAGQPEQSDRATAAAAEPVNSTPHSRRSHLPQTAASAEAEAAAVTSLPAALAPGAGTGAAAAADTSDGTATVASTSNGFANNAASSAADPDLSTQALSAQDVRDAETPRYRPRRAHLPEGVHDRNPAQADVVVAPTFRQADSAHALPQLPATRGTADKGIKRSAVSPGMPHGQKVLLWIAGSLVMVLVLVAMYLLSSRLGEQSVVDNQGAGEVVDADPTPVLTVDSGPVAPGVHDWTELAGGECLTGFESAWAEEFTVVDCADEHTAQVLTRAELSAGPDAPFPGAETLTTDVGVLCGLPAVLNYGEAAAVSDIQVSSSHPVDAADWSTGDRTYFCFVDRVSGDVLPGDLQVVPAS